MSPTVPVTERLSTAWPFVVAQSSSPWLTSASGLFVCAVASGAIGIYLMLQRGPRSRWVGAGLALVGLLFLAGQIQPLGDLGPTVGFWCLAGLTIIAAVATIVSCNPVYSAIWFAISLLGTGSLFLLQGAQFLAVATVAVYAGAIVVTFLFVLMLAQPGGHAFYDRIHWGPIPTFLASLAGATFVGGITLAVGAMPGAASLERPPDTVNAVASEATTSPKATQDDQHVAALGGQLFARHLVAVEVVGTLLLVALVGAVAIVIQGKDSPEEDGGPSHE